MVDPAEVPVVVAEVTAEAAEATVEVVEAAAVTAVVVEEEVTFREYRAIQSKIEE